MTINKLVSKYKSTSYGIIGEETSAYNIHVGDIIAFIHKSDYTEDIRLGIAVKQGKEDFIMGWKILGGVRDFLRNTECYNVVIKHYDVTEEIINTIWGEDFFRIVKTTRVPMTLEEIEEELGYEIEIIE